MRYYTSDVDRYPLGCYLLHGLTLPKLSYAKRSHKDKRRWQRYPVLRQRVFIVALSSKNRRKVVFPIAGLIPMIGQVVDPVTDADVSVHKLHSNNTLSIILKLTA